MASMLLAITGLPVTGSLILLYVVLLAAGLYYARSGRE